MCYHALHARASMRYYAFISPIMRYRVTRASRTHASATRTAIVLALELHRAIRICTHPCYSHYLGLLLATRVTGETCVIRTYLCH